MFDVACDVFISQLPVKVLPISRDIALWVLTQKRGKRDFSLLSLIFATEGLSVSSSYISRLFLSKLYPLLFRLLHFYCPTCHGFLIFYLFFFSSKSCPFRSFELLLFFQ